MKPGSGQESGGRWIEPVPAAELRRKRDRFDGPGALKGATITATFSRSALECPPDWDDQKEAALTALAG